MRKAIYDSKKQNTFGMGKNALIAVHPKANMIAPKIWKATPMNLSTQQSQRKFSI